MSADAARLVAVLTTIVAQHRAEARRCVQEANNYERARYTREEARYRSAARVHGDIATELEMTLASWSETTHAAVSAPQEPESVRLLP